MYVPFHFRVGVAHKLVRNRHTVAIVGVYSGRLQVTGQLREACGVPIRPAPLGEDRTKNSGATFRFRLERNGKRHRRGFPRILTRKARPALKCAR